MICEKCKNTDHKNCDDVLHDRLYRSCDCQHVTENSKKPKESRI